MTRRQALVAGLAAMALLVLPGVPVGIFVRGAARMASDVGLLFVLLWALQWVRGGWRGQGASWRSLLVAVPWAVLASFEVARAITREATNEDLPLYDALLLSRHLFVLGRDLYGALAYVPIVLAVIAPFLVWGLGALLLRPVERMLRALGPRSGALVALGFLALGIAGEILPGTRAITPILVRNARTSYALWAEVERSVARGARAELDAIALEPRPDLVFYVIESYGEVCAGAPDYAERWGQTLDLLDAVATDAGWHTAAGWGKAPVHGGRSWIADASLLSGVKIAHQSSYEHLLARLDEIPTLPAFLERNGYTTVLIKPADRAREGVKLENPFGFDRTVFALDLDYDGPIVGWGRVPDQYTIEYVQQHVLDGIDAPTFAFFHLATAHMPWADVPPIVEDWTAWNRGELGGRELPVFNDRTVESEVAMRISRFRRRHAPTTLPREGDEAEREAYLGTIRYDLEAVGRRLAHGPRRPALVVVMGDHQPPLVAQGRGFEVPVHLFASDPALLAPFLEAGFTPGTRPAAEMRPLRHDQLPLLLARALDGLP